MKVRGEWKSWLKTLLQQTNIMASDSITSWQIDGETMETVSYFILGGSKITADGDCSHEVKRHFLFGRKSMTNLSEWVKSLSHVQLFATPGTVSYQAPPSVEFSRQQYWSELPFPSLEDLPNPGIEPWSPALQADALLSEPAGKSLDNILKSRDTTLPTKVWKVVVESRCRDSWPLEEENSIRDQRRGLIIQSFCVIKFY